MTDLPDGAWAVPDPHQPARITLWRVAWGRLHAWPTPGSWAPTPPAGLSGPALSAWYRTVLTPWRQAIRQSITADLDQADALFARHCPPDHLPPPPPALTRHRRGTARARQQQTVRDAVRSGASLRAAALAAGVSHTTAWRWTQPVTPGT